MHSLSDMMPELRALDPEIDSDWVLKAWKHKIKETDSLWNEPAIAKEHFTQTELFENDDYRLGIEYVTSKYVSETVWKILSVPGRCQTIARAVVINRQTFYQARELALVKLTEFVRKEMPKNTIPSAIQQIILDFYLLIRQDSKSIRQFVLNYGGYRTNEFKSAITEFGKLAWIGPAQSIMKGQMRIKYFAKKIEEKLETDFGISLSIHDTEEEDENKDCLQCNDAFADVFCIECNSFLCEDCHESASAEDDHSEMHHVKRLTCFAFDQGWK